MQPNKSKLTWDDWNTNGGPQYPNEKVVQYTFRNFQRDLRASKKALDLGCGSGVHSLFLATEGFELYFNDISEVGIKNTVTALKHKELTFAGYEVVSARNSE